jgi:signal transduction histidine kinase
MLRRAAARSVIGMERAKRFPGGERAADLLLWLVITAPLLLPTDEVPAGQPGGLPLLWVRIAAAPLLGLAVYLARRQPVAAAAVPAALGLAVTPELYTTNSFVIAQVVLAYLLGRRAAGRRPPLLLFGAVCAAGGLLLLVAPSATVEDGLSLVADILLVLALPWLAGLYVRQRDELTRAGWQLAERLEREHELVGDRARLRERSRIAKDMHDSLGHELSLIALRAAALHVAEDIGPQGRQAAGELRRDAAAATQRLHEVIRVLREDGEGAPAPPVAETVASLVQRATASGVPVTLDDRLQPEDGGGAAQALPPMTDRAIYRVVQEALTNATKHAPGAPVTVTLRRDGAQAEVIVVDEAPAALGPPNGTGGYGLVSLDERVRQAGGTLRAQPIAGGFAVTARLPLAASAPLTASAPSAPPGETGASRRELAMARRTTRRRMLHTVWLPAATAAVLLLLMIGYDFYIARSSVLDANVYEQLRIGERQSSVENRLPAHEARPGRAPADPPGADRCRFYYMNTEERSPGYRLCFTGGLLSHKAKVELDN